ncbi:hypothetical protein T439DRAFT_330104 [Meredithblackwellia eburnea MCA 4105]
MALSTSINNTSNSNNNNPAKTGAGQGQRRARHQQQDINHLLGFTLPPRPPPPPPSSYNNRSSSSTSGPRRSSKKYNSNNHNHHHNSHDKERYVSTAFRFVLNPTSDYTAHFADADIRFDWDDVLQVVVDTTTKLAVDDEEQHFAESSAALVAGTQTCPICLSEPTAARMTRCGHVYCLACMLHYLALADGTKWRKCPVCHESVYAKDLRPVKWHDPYAASLIIPQPSSSSEPILIPTPPTSSSTSTPLPKLKMRLIRRPQLTTLALPRSPTWPSEAVPPLLAPWEFTPDALTYSKFVLGSPDYYKGELEAELRELGRELKALGGGPDGEIGAVFVNAAMEDVRNMLVKVSDMKTQWVMTVRKRAVRELEAVEGRDRVGEAAGRGGLEGMSTTTSENTGAETAATASTGASTSNSEGEGDDGNPGGIAEGMKKTSLASSTATLLPPASSRSIVPGLGPTRPARGNGAPSNNPSPTSTLPASLVSPDSSYFFYQSSSGQLAFLHPLDIRILKSHFGTYELMPDVIEIGVEAVEEGTMNDELRRRCKWLSHLPLGAEVSFLEAELIGVVGEKGVEPFKHALGLRRGKRKEKAKREDRAKAKSEQREREARPQANSEIYPTFSVAEQDETFFPLPVAGGTSGGSTSGSPPRDGDDFPLSTSPPASTTMSNGPRTVWGTRSFANSASGGGGSSRRVYEDEDEYDFDERWHAFEEGLSWAGGRKGSTTGANAGGGRSGGSGAESTSTTGTSITAGGKKKKNKKLVLNLTGASGRGTV